MDETPVHPSYFNLGVRWSARILGLWMTALIVLTWLARDSDWSLLTDTEKLSFSVLGVSVAGLVIAWTDEVLGGALNIAGVLAFYTMYFAVNGRVARGAIFPLMVVPGVLFLISWWRGAPRPSK